MTLKRRQDISFRGADLTVLGRELLVSGLLDGLPETVAVGSVATAKTLPYRPDAEPYGMLEQKTRLKWTTRGGFAPNVLLFQDEPMARSVRLYLHGWRPTLDELLTRIAPLPFFSFSGYHLYEEWTIERGQPFYVPRNGFGIGHIQLGWGCAFKGEGHERHLISRRLLHHGPWRTVRSEDHDVTFVFFHDLEADPATALDQAKLGHARMGYGFLTTGIFFHENHRIGTDLTGLYVPEQRLYRIMTSDNLSPKRVLDAGFLRASRRDGPDPIERLAFLFTDADQARRHLKLLWLAEMECWTMGDEGPVRLDEGYVPDDLRKPEWVAEVEAR